ncbi:hypothetical protein ACFX19_023978 [Malus domestica]
MPRGELIVMLEVELRRSGNGGFVSFDSLSIPNECNSYGIWLAFYHSSSHQFLQTIDHNRPSSSTLPNRRRNRGVRPLMEQYGFNPDEALSPEPFPNGKRKKKLKSLDGTCKLHQGSPRPHELPISCLLFLEERLGE